MSEPIEEDLIIVFDTETTGFSPVMHEIIQLSYIVYDIANKRVVYVTEEGDDIVNITGSIPPQTTAVHGITKEMTVGKAPIEVHIDKFMEWCNKTNKFVGHNIGFDIRMIVGQIDKIIAKNPTDENKLKYKEFLDKFQSEEMICCTLKEYKRKQKSGEIIGNKKAKLIDVHKTLFNQDVKGQLHNALVDISVTLRVYLMLTNNLDICVEYSGSRIESDVKDNIYICDLIKPENITNPQATINYTGELITGLNILSGDEGIEKNTIKVYSEVTSVATGFVNNLISNVVNKIASTMSYINTNIVICKEIIKSGANKGKECGRDYGKCVYHNPSLKKPKKLSQIVPFGGRRRKGRGEKTRKRKNTRKPKRK
jgi:DNA polymerase III epsilon subunit-like protein